MDLSENNITHLSEAEFYTKKFQNLQKIYLNSNQIDRIAPNAFHKLTGLIELDLSSNFLVDLHERALVSQMISSLDGDTSKSSKQSKNDNNNKRNKTGNEQEASVTTRRLKSTFLYELTQLRQLNLASNQLGKLDAFTFIRMGQLRQLFLSE